MNRIQFAIIGTGAIAGKHAQAIEATQGAHLKAVWGRNPGVGSAFASQTGAEFVSDYDRLLEDSAIDAVTIATPSGSHAELAIPFLKKGKAVFCEKPLDVTTEKVDRMLRAAGDYGTILAAVLQLRLGAGARTLKEAVRSGRFGQIALAGAYLKWWRDQDYYDSVSWRGTTELDGGGALMNQGIHGVDLLQWLVGMPFRLSAFQSLSAHERIDVEDTIAVNLEFSHGGLGVIEASTAAYPGTAMRIEICGSDGSAVLEDDRIVRWDFRDERPEDRDIKKSGGGIVGGASDPNAIGFEGHRILIEDLVSAIKEQRSPRIPGTEARNAVHLIEAAYASARSGQVVSMNLS